MQDGAPNGQLTAVPTPLEIMARAYISAGISPKYWDELSTQNQLAVAACMRAALLALAAAEIPEKVSRGNPLVIAGFQCMLRALASPNDEGKGL